MPTTPPPGFVSIAWLAIDDTTTDEGFYLISDEAIAAERKALAEAGAPNTDDIVFVSILPEDRDSAMVEAFVLPATRDWLKDPANDVVVYDE